MTKAVDIAYIQGISSHHIKQEQSKSMASKKNQSLAD